MMKLPFKSLGLLAATAVAVTSFSLPVLPPPVTAPSGSIVNAAAVPAVNDESAPATVNPLSSPDAPGTKATVIGTSASTIPGDDMERQGPVIKTVAFPMAPSGTNDKGAGDFTALPGTSSGSWGTTGQTGGFTWTYPLSVRNAPAGPSPSLGLSYDSTRVDGLTSATNNQASAIGDGWSLSGAGRISQKFVPCADQSVTGSYDLCGNPGGQSVSINFGGRSGELVRNADPAANVWKLSKDDGSKVEYLKRPGTNGTYDGGYWKITDTSGTQYFFGLNKLPGWTSGPTTNSVDTVPVGAATADQPCAADSFADSLCQQAQGWNLDYIVDVHGNSQAFYYSQATNHYHSQAGTGAIMQYVRSSRLDKIEYGMRAGSELSTSAPQKVQFDYTGRCTDIECPFGTDVPTDLSCQATGTCTVQSPTFYMDYRLKGIQTESLVAGTYRAADRWNLKHSMPDPKDGTKPALWLGSVQHQGLNTQAGQTAITDPPVEFSGHTRQNRVWEVDGLAPLNRFRLSSIKTVTGATIAVSYMGADCTPTSLPGTPETNTRRCYPQWWTPTTPITQPARMDWFHIYPVSAVTVDAGPGGAGSLSQTTTYQYLGTPAWKYPEPDYKTGKAGEKLTWSVAAGWAQVKTLTASSTTLTTYLRGLDQTPSNTSGGRNNVGQTASNGTTVTDSRWFAGKVLETQSFLSNNGALLKATVNVPWASAPTATGATTLGTPTARYDGTSRTWTKSATDTGWRTTQSDTYFDHRGRPKAVSHALDLATTADDTCTLTAYADAPTPNLWALPATISTHAGACTSNGGTTGALLKATHNTYDTSANPVPDAVGYTTPTKGSVTSTRQAKTIDGSNVTQWETGPTQAYDALGRLSTSTNVTAGAPRITTTTYTPATGPPTSVTVTNALGWGETTAFDPVRGQELTITDANSNVTTNTYDASGRITATWDPTRPKADNTVPTTATTYNVSQSQPSWVKTANVNFIGSASETYKIYDGLGRLRQTQEWSTHGGTIANDTLYGDGGQKALERHNYYLTTNPDGALKIPTLAVSRSTDYQYDTAGRLIRTRNLAYDNQEQWSTTISYAGTNSVTTTGPGNDAATTVVTDAAGKTIARKVFRGTAPTGPADTTTYTYNALQSMTGMTDASGNTWSWSFDPLGRQISANDPDTGTTTTGYDASGRAATTTNALGTITTTDYDALDRPVKVSTALAGQGAKTLLDYTYDTEKKGQLSASTRYNGPNQDQPVTTTVSGYNGNYQPGSVKTQLPGSVGALAGTYETKTTYGKSGLPANVTHPAIGGLPAETVSHSYDGWDHLSGVASEFGVTYAGSAQMDNLNNLAFYGQSDNKLFTAGADTMGSTKNYLSWDHTTGRLQESQTLNDARNIVTDLGTTKYTYEPSGQLTSRELTYTSRPGKPAADDYQCYSYDHAGRLAGTWTPGNKNCDSGFTATGLGGAAPYAQTYSYNDNGDRSQAKRYNAAGTAAVTENYDYAGEPTDPGAFSAKTPFRQLDTRNGTGGINGPVGAGKTINVKVTGRGGIPATGVSAVAVNITVTQPTSFGNITAHAGGTTPPATSNVNYDANQTVPNFAIIPVSADGTIAFTNNSTGTVQLIADTSGYYVATGTGRPGPHQLKTLTSTPSSGTTTTSTFAWDAAGRMTNRGGQTITYTPDGKIASTSGTSTISRNANPGAATGTPPPGGTEAQSQRYYAADGSLVAILDGAGTTVTVGNATAYCTTSGAISATRIYSFNGKTVAQRTSKPGGTTTAVAFLTGDSVNTAQIMTGPTTNGGTTGITAVKRHTDPNGLTRGPSLTAIGQTAFTAAPAGKTSPGSNASNETGFSAASGYLSGTADTASALTHLGARDYDPALGLFTAPDPVLNLAEAKNFSPYLYAEGDPVNDSDPSGLAIQKWASMDDGGGGWDGSVYQGALEAGGAANVPYFAAPPPATYIPYYPPTPRAFAPSKPAPPKQARWAINWEFVGTVAGIVAGVAVCAGTAGVGCVVAGAFIATAFSTAGYIADNPDAKVEDIAGNAGTSLAMGLFPICRGGLCKILSKQNSVPTVVFSRTRAPGIAKNFDAAVGDGAPTVLQRASQSEKVANRREALRGQGKAPQGQSLDEYPFASSKQGGAGSRVSPVPVSEQNYQGGVLSRFYQDNKVTTGDSFNVRFIP